MASSFSSQIPTIINLVKHLKPNSVLDIGKGFGKYGFLIHEYVGIDNKIQLRPQLTMAQQSRIIVDAVEVDQELLLPHLSQIYRNVIVEDIFNVYKTLEKYDLILMIDVIEHLEKQKAIDLVKYFLAQEATILIATPKDFFEQHLYESEYEEHISHWTKNDFSHLGNLEYQYFDAGVIYLLAPTKRNIGSFGNSFIKKIKRIARAIKSEL